MKIFRFILIVLVWGLLTYLTYESMYSVFFGDTLVFGGLVLIGLFILIWTIVKDIKLYKTQKRIDNFLLTFICAFFLVTILTIEIKIQYNFNKPTLLKVFYNGDYNGTGIDFKTDGTYIFDNSAMGLSDYFYGTYKIDKTKITLDRDKIDNLNGLKHLEIREKEIKYGSSARKEWYLFQVDTNGNIIDRTTEYRITIDNRSK